MSALDNTGIVESQPKRFEGIAHSGSTVSRVWAVVATPAMATSRSSRHGLASGGANGYRLSLVVVATMRTSTGRSMRSSSRRAVDDVGQQARPFVELHDGHDVGRVEAGWIDGPVYHREAVEASEPNWSRSTGRPRTDRPGRRPVAASATSGNRGNVARRGVPPCRASQKGFGERCRARTGPPGPVNPLFFPACLSELRPI